MAVLWILSKRLSLYIKVCKERTVYIKTHFPGIVSFVNAAGPSRLLWDSLNKVHPEYYDNCSTLNCKLPCRLRI